jgi:acyl-CoA thioesterase-1
MNLYDALHGLKRRAVILLAALSALAGCAEAPPPLAPLSGQAVILAFGDSLTHGTGASAAQSYPSVLAGLSGRTVINAGKPGEVSRDGVARLERLLDQHAPALLLLCHGGNDLLRKYAAAETEANLRAMIQLAHEREVPVVLIGVPKPGLLLSSAEFYPRLAEEWNLPYEGTVLAEVIGDRRMKSDTVHPNGLGYRKVAEAVHRLLRQSGAL